MSERVEQIKQQLVANPNLPSLRITSNSERQLSLQAARGLLSNGEVNRGLCFTREDLVELRVITEADTWVNSVDNPRMKPVSLDKLYKLIRAIYAAQLVIRTVDPQTGQIVNPAMLDFEYLGVMAATKAMLTAHEWRFNPRKALEEKSIFTLVADCYLYLPDDTYGEDIFRPVFAEVAYGKTNPHDTQSPWVLMVYNSLYAQFSDADSVGRAVMGSRRLINPAFVEQVLTRHNYHNPQVAFKAPPDKYR